MADNYATATYVLVPNVNVMNHVVDLAIETSMDTLRYATKGNPNRAVLKFRGAVPAEINMFPTYNYTDWVAIRDDPDGNWVEQ